MEKAREEIKIARFEFEECLAENLKGKKKLESNRPGAWF